MIRVCAQQFGHNPMCHLSAHVPRIFRGFFVVLDAAAVDAFSAASSLGFSTRRYLSGSVSGVKHLFVLSPKLGLLPVSGTGAGFRTAAEAYPERDTKRGPLIRRGATHATAKHPCLRHTASSRPRLPATNAATLFSPPLLYYDVPGHYGCHPLPLSLPSPSFDSRPGHPLAPAGRSQRPGSPKRRGPLRCRPPQQPSRVAQGPTRGRGWCRRGGSECAPTTPPRPCRAPASPARSPRAPGFSPRERPRRLLGRGTRARRRWRGTRGRSAAAALRRAFGRRGQGAWINRAMTPSPAGDGATGLSTRFPRVEGAWKVRQRGLGDSKERLVDSATWIGRFEGKACRFGKMDSAKGGTVTARLVRIRAPTTLPPRGSTALSECPCEPCSRPAGQRSRTHLPNGDLLDSLP